MGLDQYAYISHHTMEEIQDEEAKVDLGYPVYYWRKHNRLEGWMSALWRKNTGNTSPFNCELVQITLEDFEELERIITDRSLPKTNGFFFGKDSYNNYEEHLKDKDLAFIDKARDALNKGLNVYYLSWW